MKDLIKKLLNKDPKERIGCNGADEILEHPTFKLYNFDMITKRQIRPNVTPDY